MIFNFFHLYLSILVGGISIISNGYILKKLTNINNLNSHAENALFGIILISIITFFINFFFNISSIISYLILFVPIIFSFNYIYKNFRDLIIIALIISSLSALIMVFDNSNRPDAGLYHLPFIQIINEFKIILGSANMHFRFGHTSIIQYLSAAFNNELFTEKGITIPLSFFFSVSIIYFFTQIKNNKDIFLKILFIMFLFNIVYSMNRYSGLGNDEPAHIFFFLTVMAFINSTIKKNSYKELVIFSSFTFLIKPFYVFGLLFPLLALLLNKNKFFSKINIICSVIIFLWLFRNILISSCALFPVKQTCITNLKWSMPIETVISVNDNSEAWAKSWPNYLDEGNSISPEKFKVNFFWVGTWTKYHSKIVVKEISYQIFLIFFLLLFFRTNFDISKKNKKIINICLIFNFICVVFWFLKFPIYRYGQAYIISFLSLLYLSLTTSIYSFKKIKFDKFFKIFLILCLSALIMKHSKRIYEIENHNYLTAPWPKIYSFLEKNELNKNKPIMRNGYLLYYNPFPYTLCMFSQAPCSVYPASDNLRMLKKFNYLIYFNEKS